MKRAAKKEGREPTPVEEMERVRTARSASQSQSRSSSMEDSQSEGSTSSAAAMTKAKKKLNTLLKKVPAIMHPSMHAACNDAAEGPKSPTPEPRGRTRRRASSTEAQDGGQQQSTSTSSSQSPAPGNSGVTSASHPQPKTIDADFAAIRRWLQSGPGAEPSAFSSEHSTRGDEHTRSATSTPQVTPAKRKASISNSEQPESMENAPKRRYGELVDDRTGRVFNPIAPFTRRKTATSTEQQAESRTGGSGVDSRASVSSDQQNALEAPGGTPRSTIDGDDDGEAPTPHPFTYERSPSPPVELFVEEEEQVKGLSEALHSAVEPKQG